MPSDATMPRTDGEDTETTTISTNTDLTVEREAVTMITGSIAVHAVVGDSEFEQALVGSNPDSDKDGCDLVAFGYHADELDTFPAVQHTDDHPEDPETITITTDTELTINQEAIKEVAEGVAVHEIVGDSEFDRAIVGSNADSDEQGDLVAFGYQKDELPDPL